MTYLNDTKKKAMEEENTKINSLLLAMDKMLDSFPNILSYYPKLQNIFYRTPMLSSHDNFKQEMINDLLQKTFTDYDLTNYDSISNYIEYPDFKPQFCCESKNKSEISLLNGIYAADYWERFVEIDAKMLKKMYDSFCFGDSIHDKIGSSLFLERKYNKRDYFLAVRTSVLTFAHDMRVREPEIVL